MTTSNRTIFLCMNAQMIRGFVFLTQGCTSLCAPLQANWKW